MNTFTGQETVVLEMLIHTFIAETKVPAAKLALVSTTFERWCYLHGPWACSVMTL